jgi:hypothetical protein
MQRVQPHRGGLAAVVDWVARRGVARYKLTHLKANLETSFFTFIGSRVEKANFGNRFFRFTGARVETRRLCQDIGVQLDSTCTQPRLGNHSFASDHDDNLAMPVGRAVARAQRRRASSAAAAAAAALDVGGVAAPGSPLQVGGGASEAAAELLCCRSAAGPDELTAAAVVAVVVAVVVVAQLGVELRNLGERGADGSLRA